MSRGQLNGCSCYWLVLRISLDWLYIYILGWCWRYHDGDGDDGLWTNECSRGVRSRFSGNGSTGWMVQITTNYDRLLGATNHKFYLLSRNRTYNWYMMICVFNRSPKFYQFIARILLFFLAGYVCICNTMYDICIHNMQTFAYITYIIIYICNVCNVCNMMHYIYICVYIHIAYPSPTLTFTGAFPKSGRSGSASGSRPPSSARIRAARTWRCRRKSRLDEA